ncbi:MAG: alpha-amylase, partial [Spirochaetaceae bacterium]|nr:alpha-amylase [Spirochaetaceae bacterium]
MVDFSSRFFYHIYPLGFSGAPRNHAQWRETGAGLKAIALHAPRLAALGVNALYIGPLFESSSHGYDTVDYSRVDGRLGSNEDLALLVKTFHEHGIAVVLDAVFNHSSRDFFAFADLRARKADSPYKDWYAGVDFSRDNEHGDGFSYEGWAG